MRKEAYALPDNTITTDAVSAAEQWAKAFYKTKDAIRELRSAMETLDYENPDDTALCEALAKCYATLELGED